MDFIKTAASTHSGLLVWLGWLSLATFVISLAIIPILITRIPADYFSRTNQRSPTPKTRSFRYLITTVLRNVAGLTLVAAGVAMLLLPGQGLLTILIGIFISDFPGKQAAERKLISQPNIFKTINWIRARRGVRQLARPDSGQVAENS